MTREELDQWLAPLSAAEPCGPNPEMVGALYVKYSELQTAMAYDYDASQAVAGSEDGSNSSADRPNWVEVRKHALALLGESRHLSVLVVLAMAQLKTLGVPGLSDALQRLHGVVERYWLEVYPPLDPAEPSPLERANLLAELANPDSFLRQLNDTPVLANRALGKVTLRDLLVASGEQAAMAGRPAFTREALAQMVAEAPGPVQEQLAATNTALDEVKGLCETFDARAGSNASPNLLALTALLRKLKYQLETLLPAGAVEVTEAPASGTSAAPAASAPRGAGVSAPGTIQSREDVIRALQAIIKFYEAAEPSSPLPDYLRRAERLVGKRFREVVQELQPGAVQSFDDILGIRPDNQ